MQREPGLAGSAAAMRALRRERPLDVRELIMQARSIEPRTIADRAGADDIGTQHLSEAVQYHTLDRETV